MEKNHTNFKIESSGLHINPKYPYFGASPDGITNCDCCGVSILEIKCPYCIQFKSILNLSENGYSFIKSKNGELTIKEEHDYYYQIQMQMAITNKKYCYLVGWCKKDFAFARVPFNESFWKDNSEVAKTFFYDVILPECLAKYYTRQKDTPYEIDAIDEESNEEMLEIGFYEELIYENPDAHPNVHVSKPLSPKPGPSKTLYCLCRTEDDSITPMIACESKNCFIEWYHLKCVGLTKVPDGIWICERCKYSDSE